LLIYKIIYGFLILLSIVTINEISAQNNYNETITFVDPYGKFSIDYPSDWDAIAPGHRFVEEQGYIEIRHEEITSEIKESNEENKYSSSSLNNKSLEIILPSSFQDYVSKINLHNFRQIEEFNYDRYLISGLNTGSIVYSFEKDFKIFYGLYILAKNDNNIVFISYTSSINYFYKNLWQVEEMINSLKFKL
jgi:hypothetical protein